MVVKAVDLYLLEINSFLKKKTLYSKFRFLVRFSLKTKYLDGHSVCFHVCFVPKDVVVM